MTTIPFLFLIFQHFKDHKYIWAAFVEWLAYFTISVEVRVRRRSTKINLLDDNVIICDRQKSRWMDGQIDDVPMSSNVSTHGQKITRLQFFEREKKNSPMHKLNSIVVETKLLFDGFSVYFFCSSIDQYDMAYGRNEKSHV